MNVTFRGIVTVDGRKLYARGFWNVRHAERWFVKRVALGLIAEREGEVVTVVDASGKEVARAEFGL